MLFEFFNQDNFRIDCVFLKKTKSGPTADVFLKLGAKAVYTFELSDELARHLPLKYSLFMQHATLEIIKKLLDQNTFHKAYDITKK